MADDVTLPGRGDIIAADDVNNKKYQWIKIAVGADGSADPNDATHPLYIAPSSTAGMATEAKQTSIITALTTIAGHVDGLEGKDYATQTTLSDILAKIISSPATEAKQDSSITQETAINTVLGTKADAKNAATDTTAVSLIALSKQLSEYLKNLVTSFGSTAIDFGSGALSSRTLRVLHATDDPLITAFNGTIADGAADSGNTSKVGGVVTTGLSAATTDSAGDRVPVAMTSDRKALMQRVPHEDIVSGGASNTDGASTEFIAAGGSNVKQYLTRVSLSNTHATNSVMVALKSGTTTKWRCNVPPGGREIFFDPPLPPNAANEAWNFDPDSATTTIECYGIGYKSRV